MPYLDGALGRVYYRDWALEAPRATLILSHGYGEHSGLFHRFAFAANQAGFRVLGIDAVGHGLSEGERGKAPVDALAKNVALVADLAEESAPGAALALVGHSMGSLASALALVDQPQRYACAVLTGSPILDFDPSVLGELDDVVMSRDPFYLDQLETDPLEAWLADDGGPGADLAAHEPAIWAGLPELDVPLLFVNGEEDRIAPPAMGRAAAARCRNARAVEIAGGCHDILNDAPYAEVTEHILTFVAGARLQLV